MHFLDSNETEMR